VSVIERRHLFLVFVSLDDERVGNEFSPYVNDADACQAWPWPHTHTHPPIQSQWQGKRTSCEPDRVQKREESLARVCRPLAKAQQLATRKGCLLKKGESDGITQGTAGERNEGGKEEGKKKQKKKQQQQQKKKKKKNPASSQPTMGQACPSCTGAGPVRPNPPVLVTPVPTNRSESKATGT